MGQRGPRPTPTELLIASGSRRASRRSANPKPAAGRPSKPKWLVGAAAKHWSPTLKRIQQVGTLARTDGEAIARYCLALARLIRANAMIEKIGEVHTYFGEDGKVKYRQQHPEVTILNNLYAELRRLEQEFGLTPAARAGLHVTESTATRVASRDRFKARIVE